MQEGSEETLEEAPKEETFEEGRIIKGQQRIVKPGREEWDNHMRVHIPYRKWCPHCVDGKRKAGVHGSDQLVPSTRNPCVPKSFGAELQVLWMSRGVNANCKVE